MGNCSISFWKYFWKDQIQRLVLSVIKRWSLGWWCQRHLIFYTFQPSFQKKNGVLSALPRLIDSRVQLLVQREIGNGSYFIQSWSPNKNHHPNIITALGYGILFYRCRNWVPEPFIWWEKSALILVPTQVGIQNCQVSHYTYQCWNTGYELRTKFVV